MSEVQKHIKKIEGPDQNTFAEIINNRVFVGTIVRGKITHSRVQWFIDAVLDPWISALKKYDPESAGQRDKYFFYSFEESWSWDRLAREIKTEWLQAHEEVIEEVRVLCPLPVEVGVNSVGSLLRARAALANKKQYLIQAHTEVATFRSAIDRAALLSAHAKIFDF